MTKQEIIEELELARNSFINVANECTTEASREFWHKRVDKYNEMIASIREHYPDF